MLILKSDAKGICLTTVATVSNHTIILTNITVGQAVADNGHQYPTQCESAGSSVRLYHYEFSCGSLDEPKEIQFVIRGYSNSIGHWWSAAVALVPHNCSTGAYFISIHTYMHM